MNSHRRGSLDDLRAIAITLVVLMHGYAAFVPRPDSIKNPLLIFIYAGGTGVTLFFILSGYLVSMPFIKAAQEGHTYSVSEHFKQRALRILPTYYFYVLVSCALTGRFDQFIPALFFLVDSNELSIYSNVWWSLTTEVQFYLAIPLIFYLARHKHALPAMALIWLATYAYCAEYLLPGNFSSYAWITTSIIYKAPAFLVGIVLAWITASGKIKKHSQITRAFLSAAFLIALTFFLKGTAEKIGPGYAGKYPYHIVMESILWGAIFFLLLQNKSSIFRRPGQFLAEISYSLYLVHYPIIFMGVLYAKKYGIQTSWQVFAVLLASLALSILLAWISYKAIEEPFLRLKDRLRPLHKGSAGRVFP